MQASRRSILAAAGAGLAALEIGEAMAATTGADINEVASGLVRQSEKANAALMRGDLETYLGMVSYSGDFTLMSPFGGKPTRAADFSPERLEAMGRFFRNGTLKQEVVQTYASPDMIVLAVIERAHVEVGGLPAQDWALRVTLVYSREGGKWLLAHRHADPLANAISLEEAAAIARGE